MYALLSLSVKPSRYLPQRDHADGPSPTFSSSPLAAPHESSRERPGALLLALPNCSGPGTRKQTRTPPGSRGQAVRAAYPNAGTRPRPVLRGANPRLDAPRLPVEDGENGARAAPAGPSRAPREPGAGLAGSRPPLGTPRGWRRHRRCEHVPRAAARGGKMAAAPSALRGAVAGGQAAAPPRSR